MFTATEKYQELGRGETGQQQGKCWKNGPQGNATAVLDSALRHCQSVEYPVTTRWLFYRLWQDGVFERDGKGAKDRAYNNFCQILARLRHSPVDVLKRWPIEVVDDTRDKVGGGGFTSPNAWLNALGRGLVCQVDPMRYLDHYVMVAFEAQAMTRQFDHICKPYGVTLWPFSGHASIAYKKQFARHIDAVADVFGKPITILYFGDLDDAGATIPDSAFADVRKWAEHDFTALWCGLTPEQVTQYNVESDNGKFQWEALGHDAAVEIITGELDRFCDLRLIELALAEGEVVASLAREALRGIVLA